MAKKTVKQALAELLPESENRATSLEARRERIQQFVVFERFVIELIRLYAERASPDAVFEEEPSLGWGESTGHGFRPDGLVRGASIDDLPGPVAIEVFGFTGRQSASAYLQRRVEGRIARAVGAGVSSLIFVLTHEPTKAARARLEEFFKGFASTVKLAVWGPTRLQQLVDLLGESAQVLVDNLPAAGLASAIRDVSTGKRDRWRGEQSRLIQYLGQAWRSDSLVLFLGAGVSMDAGVPGWGGLLGELFGAVVSKMAPTIAGNPNLRQEASETLASLQGGSPLLAARHLRAGLGDRFVPALKAAMYRKVRSRPTAQLQELAKLCDPPRGRFGARAVVTYNFDDLLETHLEGLNVKYTSVFREGMRPEVSALPLYHVHGLIPQTKAVPERQLFVFSEEGYHAAYNDPYTWSNVVQLTLLTEHTGLFVGLSLTDPNLRRLLEIANRTDRTRRHVALLRRTKRLSNDCKGNDASCPRNVAAGIAPEMADAVLAAHHEIWETSLGELGVRVLWFEEFSELPGLLAQIRSTGS